MTLCEQDLADARALIRRGGLDPDEFEFACGTTTAGGPGGGAIAYEIQVTRKTTGKQRTYAGALSTDWMRHFEAELHAKLFD